MLEGQGSHCEKKEEEEQVADPFVKEGHKAIAFRFPRRHVLDHAGVSVDRQQHVSKLLYSLLFILGGGV